MIASPRSPGIYIYKFKTSLSSWNLRHRPAVDPTRIRVEVQTGGGVGKRCGGRKGVKLYNGGAGS
jgi:hypothetical protein